MPNLILVRGLPGSGKSTIARSIPSHVHVEADMYFIKEGAYVFDKALLGDAHAWCLETTKKELEKGNSVVVSNTFTRNKEMEPYFALGVPTTVIEATGTYKSIHSVPEHTVKAMKARWEPLHPRP